VRPAGGRASTARRAAPVLTSVFALWAGAGSWERAADNFLPVARGRGASRCPHLTPITADRSDARGDAAAALLPPGAIPNCERN